MKLSGKDILLIILFLFFGVLFFFPWQIVPRDESKNNIYVFFLALVWAGVCLLVFFRIRKLQIKRKWLFGLVLFILILPTMPKLVLTVLYVGLPQAYNHYVYYENVKDTNEKVLHIYYRFPMGGFWEFKHVIAVPKYNMSLERDFDYKNNDLDGIWKYYDLNNHFKYAKTVELKDGKEIRVLDEVQNGWQK